MGDRSVVIDMFYDSLCRCFLGSEGQAPPTSPQSEGKSLHRKNRGRGGQFNNLFDNNFKDVKSQSSSRHSQRNKRRNSKKRKSPAEKRDEIFRSRKPESRDPPTTHVPSNGVRYNIAQALCFATPIHDDEEESSILRSESDCNTLNTCEDTITSTVFFEKKYEHVVENRPPMPLFNQFKVDDRNELRRIVATDSHNSLKMVRLMREAHEKSSRRQYYNDDEQVPPAVKIDSSESSNDMRR